MPDTNSNALEFLEQLRKERDEINMLIAAVEKRLGVTQAAGVETENQPANGSSKPKVKVSISEVPTGFFHNLSQAKAAEKLLGLSPGQPLTTQEMIDVFRRSGMTLNPKNAATILYTALTRNERFERVAGKAWGLAEWYPESRKKQDAKKTQEKPEKPERPERPERPGPVQTVPPSQQIIGS